MRKNYFLFSFIFFIHYFVCSQTVKVSESVKKYLLTLNTANIDVAVIDKLALLIEQKEKDLALAKQIEVADSKNLVPLLYFDEIKIETINRKFMRSLMDVLTIEQYRQLFSNQLEGRIKKVAEEKIEKISNYKLTPEQYKQMKDLFYITANNEVVIRQYWAYDNDWSWNVWQREKLKSHRTEMELMEKFNQMYAIEREIYDMAKKMESLNIGLYYINEVIKLLHTEKEKLCARGIKWRDDKQKNAIEFYDEGASEYSIQMETRKGLCNFLTYEQFKAVFKSQMQPRIDREIQQGFEEFKEANKELTPEQLNDIKPLITEKYEDHVVIEECYKFNINLYQQKVRMSDYSYDSKIREKIKTFENK